MNCHECNEILNEYALGILDPMDASKVSEHIDSGCEYCRENLRSIDAATAVLSQNATPISPPDDLKGQLMKAIQERRRQKNALPTAQLDLDSGEPNSLQTKLEAGDIVVGSTSNGSLASRFVAMTLAASLISVVLSYQAVMAFQRYRWDSPRAGENRIDSYPLAEKGRSRSKADSLRFVSVPIVSSVRNADPIARAGFVAVDAFAKELHIAIDFGNLSKSDTGIICEAWTTDGQRHRLGLINRTNETMALGVFDISALSSGMVKLVVYKNDQQSNSLPAIFEISIDLRDRALSAEEKE